MYVGWWSGEVLHCDSCEELGPCMNHRADSHPSRLRLDYYSLLAVLNFLTFPRTQSLAVWHRTLPSKVIKISLSNYCAGL